MSSFRPPTVGVAAVGLAAYNGAMAEPRVIQGDHSLLTPENKERWFQRLSVEERYALFEEQLQIAADINPQLLKRHAPYSSRSVRIVSLPQR